MFPELYNPIVFIKQLAMAVVPSWFLSPAEMEVWPGMAGNFKNLMRESGYFHIQITRPDTVAFGLNDSPVGLAAYILEKFSVWTNADNRHLPDGGLTKAFTLDDLLTNVMIYWVTETIGPSVRFYKENMAGKYIPELGKLPVTVPAGL